MMMNFKMLMKALGTSCLVLACTVYSSHSAISAETAQPSKVVEKAGEVDLGALIQESGPERWTMFMLKLSLEIKRQQQQDF